MMNHRRNRVGRPMFASSGPTAREYNRLLDRADRVVVMTVEQTGCPMDIAYDLQGAWLRDWCLRHNATYYSAPRESFSLGAAKMQAAREGKNTVIVEDLS